MAKILTIAWVHRGVSYLSGKLNGNKIVSPAERAKFAKERVELLKRCKTIITSKKCKR